MATDWCPFATQNQIIADNFQKGRNGKQVTAVVLHIAAGPLTAVFPTFNNIKYVAQVYNLGIVYVKQGDWGNCKWVKKPIT